MNDVSSKLAVQLGLQSVAGHKIDPNQLSGLRISSHIYHD